MAHSPFTHAGSGDEISPKKINFFPENSSSHPCVVGNITAKLRKNKLKIFGE
jgi:hypothetical protein